MSWPEETWLNVNVQTLLFIINRNRIVIDTRVHVYIRYIWAYTFTYKAVHVFNLDKQNFIVLIYAGRHIYDCFLQRLLALVRSLLVLHREESRDIVVKVTTSRKAQSLPGGDNMFVIVFANISLSDGSWNRQKHPFRRRQATTSIQALNTESSSSMNVVTMMLRSHCNHHQNHSIWREHMWMNPLLYVSSTHTEQHVVPRTDLDTFKKLLVLINCVVANAKRLTYPFLAGWKFSC